MSTVHSAITDAIKTKLSSYNSPLDKLIESAIAKNNGEIQALLDNAVKEATQADFKSALVDATTRKLAKVLISKMEGEIEKKVGDLRSSPEFRSRLVVAIDDIVKSLAVK